jgi:hypothetical protein
MRSKNSQSRRERALQMRRSAAFCDLVEKACRTKPLQRGSSSHRRFNLLPASA